jgi:ABC-type sugar transport system substrate-binding protein
MSRIHLLGVIFVIASILPATAIAETNPCPKPVAGKCPPTTAVSVDPPVPDVRGIATEATVFDDSVVQDNFSVPRNEPTWTVKELLSIRGEGSRRGREIIPSIVTNAKDQVAAVKQLAGAGVDIIVIYPKDASVIPAMADAVNAGTKVLMIDVDPAGLVAGKDYTLAIGPDFTKQGELAAKWLVGNISRGDIVEIEGPTNLHRTTQRSEGFRRVIDAHPELRVVGRYSGSFDRGIGFGLASQALAHSNPKIIYTHDDELAIGAVEAVSKSGKRPGLDVIIVSIQDGTDGLTAIIDGEINAIVANTPNMGETVLDSIEKIQNGDPMPTFLPRNSFIYDLTNARRGLRIQGDEASEWMSRRETE